MMMDTSPKNYSPSFWCVVPAAGVGSRMGLDFPKQYLKLHNKTILEHTLERLLAIPQLQGIILSVNQADTYWPQLPLAKNPRIQFIFGGKDRCDSVMNALNHLVTFADERDWVLVHDAARPCVTLDSILVLIKALAIHPVGGILGIPVSDTLKRVTSESIIEETIDRRALWQAQTPQMFRLGLLRSCLKAAIDAHHPVTDEASAMEFCGYTPLMVEGRSDNIKITRQDDVALVQFILDQQITSDNKR